MNSYVYYEKQLTKTQQKAYHDMKTGLLALAPSFSVPKLESRELPDLYFLLRLDCPEIFYTETFRCRFYPGADHMELEPEYRFPKAKVLDHRKSMEARVKKLARQAEKGNEREKLQFIHDFLCENVRYDKLKKPYSHEILGPLGQGVGVCEGIAKSVKILCDALGIECIIALSEANPEKGIRYRHTWNVVCLGGTWYHLDVTFDLSLSKDGEIRYDYFLLSDGQIFRDHEPVIHKVPACPDGDHTYYREKKVSFTRYEDVQKRAAQAAKKGKTLTFQWRGGYLTREVLRDLLGILQEEAAAKGKYASVSLNWSQAVLRVHFESQVPETPVVMEEANEGEETKEGEEPS